MTLRTVLIIGLALAFGGSAAFLTISAVNRARGGQHNDTVPVVVAAVNVPLGTTLTAEMVTLREVPRDQVPVGNVQSLDRVVGRVVTTDLFKDDWVLEAKVTEGTGAGLAPRIPKGMRAVSVHTPTVASGVAGFIRPKNRVDVLVAMNQLSPEDRGGGVVPLLQNVEILAVDRTMDPVAAQEGKVVEQRDLRSVTLLVTLLDAEKLHFAQSKGTIYLALRNPEDQRIYDAPVIGPEDVGLGSPRPPEPPKQPDAPEVIPEPQVESPPLPLPRLRISRGVSQEAP